jgi:hypothetical protein
MHVVAAFHESLGARRESNLAGRAVGDVVHERPRAVSSVADEGRARGFALRHLDARDVDPVRYQTIHVEPTEIVVANPGDDGRWRAETADLVDEDRRCA